MRHQHVGTGLLGAVHVGFGRVECTGHAGNLGGSVAHGKTYVVPALGVHLGIARQQGTLEIGNDHAAPTIDSSV